MGCQSVGQVLAGNLGEAEILETGDLPHEPSGDVFAQPSRVEVVRQCCGPPAGHRTLDKSTFPASPRSEADELRFADEHLAGPPAEKAAH